MLQHVSCPQAGGNAPARLCKEQSPLLPTRSRETAEVLVKKRMRTGRGPSPELQIPPPLRLRNLPARRES
eukprot:gene11807-biopygen9447